MPNREETKLKAIETICNKLCDRNAVLFLGAGINDGIKDKKGNAAPLGQQLSDLIARDLLESKTLSVTLDEAAEMARYRVGDEALNKYLYNLFLSFDPGTSHLTLVQLPWDVIYTTNFDLLVEKATQVKAIQPAGVIKPVYSNQADLTSFKEEDILYYKLHGSVDYANTKEGRLILTKEDYKHYELYRKPLFKRLERDLLNRTFVFVGYALKDPNFREILEDCRNELGTKTLPFSFAIRKSFDDTEETFWRAKYNIQLIETDASDFLQLLKKTWIAQKYSVVPFESRKANEYLFVDRTAHFPKIAESFYLIDPKTTLGPSNPKLFFHGAEATWGDICEKIAPERDAYWTILEALFPEFAEPTNSPSSYLITGAAGTGKTTLVYSLAYSIAKEFDLQVLMHIPGTPLDINVIGSLVSENNPKRIVVLVRHAAEYLSHLDSFMDEAKRKNLPITLLLEERKNQWVTAITNTKRHFSPPEFELGALSINEINRILDALNKHKVLGKLTGSSRDSQVEHFTSLAHKELLVALRELISESEGQFDDIIRDEFKKIPSDTAKQAYIYVSALGQIDLSIRYETLMHILNLDIKQLREEIFTPTEGVLISGEALGSSRHNIGFRLTTRHPVIASIIFSTEAPSDDSKFEIFNNIITALDPGYNEDKRLLQEITRSRQLVGVFQSKEKKRAVYERLESALPGNPFVFQHRSILEKDLSDPQAAVLYARKALELDPRNPFLLNTLGLVLEFEARSTANLLKRRALITEASKIFDDEIRRDPTNPYAYIGKVFIIRQQINEELDIDNKALLKASALSFLEEAYEITQKAPMIAGELAIQRDQLGAPKDAITILRTALKKKPNDERLRDMLVRLEIDHDPEQAIKTAEEGIKFNPNSWRMQRHVARLKRARGEPLDAVKGYYDGAIRHRKGDIDLMIELAAYLFINKRLSEASVIFNQTRNFAIPGYEKRRIRECWKDGANQNIIFSGKVKKIVGAAAYAIAVPDNFEAFFYRTIASLSKLKEGDQIKFWVGFNAYGPTAKIISE